MFDFAPSGWKPPQRHTTILGVTATDTEYVDRSSFWHRVESALPSVGEEPLVFQVPGNSDARAYVFAKGSCNRE